MKNQQAANQRRSAEAAALWEPRRPEIIRLYHDQGLSQAALADHFGVAQAAMFKILKRLNIEPKSRGRMGVENGRYIHGMASTLYRGMVKKDSCAECGTTESLCVHHRDGNHLNNNPANLEVLCMSCHSRMHKSEWWRSLKVGQ